MFRHGVGRSNGGPVVGMVASGNQSCLAIAGSVLVLFLVVCARVVDAWWCFFFSVFPDYKLIGLTLVFIFLLY